MRVTNKKQIQALIDDGLINGASKVAAITLLKSRTKPRKSSARRENKRLCSLEPSSPALLLYQQLVRQYGRFYNGGLMVLELGFRPEGRNWRLDMAIPQLKLGIELDGWKSHGLYRDSFLRDREKSLWFERRGWRVIRFSANQVMNNRDDVLLAIEEVMSFCTDNTDKNWVITPIGFDRSEYSHESPF